MLRASKDDNGEWQGANQDMNTFVCEDKRCSLMEEVETPVVQAIFACSQIALQAFFAPREQKNDGIKQPKNKKLKVAVAADLSKPVPIPIAKFDTRVKEWFDSFDEQAKEGHIGKAPSPLQKVLIFCSLFIFIDFVC